MKTSLLTLSLLLLSHLHSNAQMTGSRHSFKPNDNVYVILPDTVSEKAKSYKKVFKENWKFCKITFITPDQKEDLKKAGNYFFGLTCFKRQDRNSKGKMELIYMQVFLQLYEYKLEKDGKKEFLSESSIVSFKLPIRDYNYFDKMIPYQFYFGGSYALDTSFYNVNNEFLMLGPGLIKNFIQRTELMVKGKVVSDDTKKDLSTVDDAKSLNKLKTETLYFPEYCLKGNGQSEEEDKVFEKYTYTYEIISEDDLNKKILEGGDEFFYVYFVCDGPRKYLNVISSKTGKVVYADFSTPSYKFNKKDIKSLMEAIQGEE